MKNLPAEMENLLYKPIIIFGSGRSGTTIISEIIFQHEQLAWHSNYQELFTKSAGINYLRRIFENKWWRLIKYWKFVGNSKNTRQKRKHLFQLFIFSPIERYSFWESITGKRINFSRGFLLGEKATEKEKKHIRHFLAKQIKYQQRQRLIIKFTGPARLEYLTSIFPDALFINVVREPIATIRSWLEVDFWQTKGINRLWWTGAYSAAEEAEAEKLKNEPALITAFQYKKLMETTAYEIKKLGVSVKEVHYENFVKDPDEFIRNILEYLQLSPSAMVEKYLNEMVIFNRNSRSSNKIEFSDEMKKKILEMVAF